MGACRPKRAAVVKGDRAISTREFIYPSVGGVGDWCLLIYVVINDVTDHPSPIATGLLLLVATQSRWRLAMWLTMSCCLPRSQRQPLRPSAKYVQTMPARDRCVMLSVT